MSKITYMSVMMRNEIKRSILFGVGRFLFVEIKMKHILNIVIYMLHIMLIKEGVFAILQVYYFVFESPFYPHYFL